MLLVGPTSPTLRLGWRMHGVGVSCTQRDTTHKGLSARCFKSEHAHGPVLYDSHKPRHSRQHIQGCYDWSCRLSLNCLKCIPPLSWLSWPMYVFNFAIWQAVYRVYIVKHCRVHKQSCACLHSLRVLVCRHCGAEYAYDAAAGKDDGAQPQCDMKLMVHPHCIQIVHTCETCNPIINHQGIVTFRFATETANSRIQKFYHKAEPRADHVCKAQSTADPPKIF